MFDEMHPLRSLGFTDPGWEHGVAQDGNKKKVKCNYCGKVVSGGIFRLKQHLARISGEVTYCKKAPDEVYVKMKENLDGYRASRRRQLEDGEHSIGFRSNDEEYEEDEEAVVNRQKRRQRRSNQSLVAAMAPLRSLGFVDPGWEHGVAQDDKKKKVKCKYCEKIVSGGINRFKQHLARIPGEVAPCKMAPEDVYGKMKENMKWHRTGRRQRPETKELAAFYSHSDNDEEEFVNDASNAERSIGEKDVSCSRSTRKGCNTRSPGNFPGSSELQPKQLNLDSFATAWNIQLPLTSRQWKLKSGDKRDHKEVISAICRFFYYAGIPFNAANSSYFQKMLDLAVQYGQALKAPSGGLISGQFLQDEVASMKECLVEIKASWSATGCTIMADTWKDEQGRTLINFLISCPRGTYFVSSIDATDIVEDATNLFKVLDKIVEEVGEEHVVQVITKNTPCYKAAGKMLEEKRRSLFWTPCAAYCIDDMLEDFVKINLVGECIEKGQKITRFIYNRAWLLNLMRKEFTSGMELLKPAVTRFATSFLTLQGLMDHRTVLRKMFQSNKWRASQLAKSDEGKEVEMIILNATFWKKMQFVNKSVHPIVDVLKKVDSEESLPMSSIYHDMYRAKLSIKAVHGDNERKYGPYWSVIDSHWSSLFHHPLYVAAYYLNPAYHYRPDFMAIPEVIRGVNECITRLELDNGRRVSAAMQISEFDFAKADFGTELALTTRKDLHPAAWWQQHGINCLELQRIATRILSQTCSSIGCEHNWSSFDQVYSTRNNRLAQKKLNDITYVHYNLRLKERQSKKIMTDDSISLDSLLVESTFQDWVIDNQKTELQEDEEIVYNEMEQAEYDNEADENGELDTEPKEAHADSVVLSELVGPLQVHPASENAASDGDDADISFLDDFSD